LVLPREVIDPESNRYPTVAPESMCAAVRHSRGSLLTVDRLILDAKEKAELYRSSGADLIDMESAAVAGICAEKLVRFLAVRVISDDSRTDLPLEVASLMTQSGSYRIGAALRAIWNRPSSIKDFWSLHEHALEAADRLAKFVVRCLDDLPA
jgi:adenosylhomocysteine nucleosidase